MENKKTLTIEVMREVIKNNPDINLIDDKVLKIIIEETLIDKDDFQERILHKLKLNGINNLEERDLCKLKLTSINNDKVSDAGWFLIGVCAGGAICYLMM
jgi:hypothetical protein